MFRREHLGTRFVWQEKKNLANWLVNWTHSSNLEPKRPVTLKQNRAILHPMMLVSTAIWESGDAKSPRIARCRIARPAVISIAWFCIKQFLYGFSKDCVPARHGSVKFVHWCLALTTPVLPALLFRREVECRVFFFFFASITARLIVFEKPNQQNQKKCRGGYFRRDNRDQLVPGFRQGQCQLRQEQNGLAPGVFWQSLRQWVQKTNW